MADEKEQTPKGMSPAVKAILIGLGVAVGIAVLVLCIVAPWRKSGPLEPIQAVQSDKKAVTFDESKNIEYPPEPEVAETPEPDEQKDEQAGEEGGLPPLSSEEPAAEEDRGNYSKDSVLREAQNTHRNQLMRSAGKVNTGEPTTGSLMMNSMNTRVENHGRFSQGSTAVMQRFKSTGTNSGEEEAAPIQATHHSTII